MPVDYREDPEIAKMVTDLIASPKLSQLKALTKHGVIILTAVCERTNNQAETQAAKSDPIKLKKISPAEQLFMRDNAHYLLVIDAGFWADCNDKRRKALLANALFTIEVEGDETSGNPKFKKRDYDYQGFTQVTVALGTTDDHQRESMEVVASSLFGLAKESMEGQAERVVPKAAPAAKPAAKAAPAAKAKDPEPEPEEDSGPTPEVPGEAPEETPEEAPAPPRARITTKGFVTRPNRPNRTAAPQPEAEPEPEPEPAPAEDEDNDPPRVRAVPVPTRRTGNNVRIPRE